MNINRSVSKVSSNDTKIFDLRKELVLLKIKQKTQQNIKTHLFRKIKREIAQKIRSQT